MMWDLEIHVSANAKCGEGWRTLGACSVFEDLRTNSFRKSTLILVTPHFMIQPVFGRLSGAIQFDWLSESGPHGGHLHIRTYILSPGEVGLLL